MMHGIGIYTYLSDEDQTSGTSWVLETLNRSLQYTYEKLRRESKPLPPVLQVFADNTPKDAHAIEASELRSSMFWDIGVLGIFMQIATTTLRK